MAERKVRIRFPLPTSPEKEAREVPIKESTERWTEVTLEDDTIIRLKVSLMGATRIDGEFDAEGNPAYSLKMVPTVVIANAPDHLRKPTKTIPVQ